MSSVEVYFLPMDKTQREISRGYDEIAQRVGLSAKFYRAVVGLAGRLSGRVVDVGCGRGFLLEEIRSRAPGVSVFGGDISTVLAAEARIRNPGGKFFQADAAALPFQSGVFDFVFLTEVLEHLQDFKKGLLEIRRVLRPAGGLLVTVPNRDWIRYDAYMKNRKPFQPIDDHWFTKKELEELLISAGFEIERVDGAETLTQRSGVMRILEKFAVWLNPSLRHKMKRLMVRAKKMP